MTTQPADEDLELVRLAAAWYRFEGNRAQDVRERFDLGMTSFWQRVNAALEDPAVALALPVEVARLRRQRDGRKAQKTA